MSARVGWAFFVVGWGCSSGGDEPGAPACDPANGLPQSTRAEPDPKFLPKPTSACPEMKQGTVSFTVDGVERKVELWVGEAAKTLDGPLVFYWHGSGQSPQEAEEKALGSAVIGEIVAQGGMVAAFYPDPGAGNFPWYLTIGDGQSDRDLRVADEVLACAEDQLDMDETRIHALGMSAGGLNTFQMSYLRSGYLASVVTYSGGDNGNPEPQDPENRFPALIFHGGPDDVVIIEFETASKQYYQQLRDTGHFAAICNHGRKHTIPTDQVDNVWRFFQDHPFGTAPSPYACSLPPSFPDWCTL